MRKLALLPFAALALLAGCGDESGSPVGATPGARGVLDSADPVVDVPAGPDVAVTHIPFATNNNPTCGDLLPGSVEIKIEPVAVTSRTANGVTVWITRVAPTSGATEIDWHASVPMDGVLLKSGADGHFFYNYAAVPAVGPQEADDGLKTSGQAISHLSFCFTPRLRVSKTAAPRYTRTFGYDWDIDKTGTADSLNLSTNQVYAVGYTVEVTADEDTADSGFGVSGQINIHNPWAQVATIDGVSDAVSGGFTATVTACRVGGASVGVPSGGAPYGLAGGATMVCDYDRTLPDATDRTNTATVTVTPASAVKGGSGTAPVDFGAPTTVLSVDECVSVADPFDEAGPRVVCVGQLVSWKSSFTYSHDVMFPVCGDYDVNNTATYTANDTGETGSDSWVVDVVVPCGGCTLTQGYWKTHSDRGPAPYDDAWKNLGPLQEDTPFFISGQTWFVVFWTAPAGNPYYVLAHQYQAAKLNRLNGATSTLAVNAAMSGAEGFFAAKTPASVLTKAQRQQVLGWAGTLDQYNNGLIGPGHCSEQT
jgi:hypothetical protein